MLNVSNFLINDSSGSGELASDEHFERDGVQRETEPIQNIQLHTIYPQRSVKLQPTDVEKKKEWSRARVRPQLSWASHSD